MPLGYTVDAAGTYNIGIDHFDAQFANINIYLEDLLLGITHDLKVAPYVFTATPGISNARFVLRYTTQNLSVNNFDSLDVTAFITASKLNVRATQSILEVQVFDISGKLIKTFVPTTDLNTHLWDFNYAQGAYLAKIKLENGLIETRKLLI